MAASTGEIPLSGCGEAKWRDCPPHLLNLRTACSGGNLSMEKEMMLLGVRGGGVVSACDACGLVGTLLSFVSGGCGLGDKNSQQNHAKGLTVSASKPVGRLVATFYTYSSDNEQAINQLCPSGTRRTFGSAPFCPVCRFGFFCGAAQEYLKVKNVNADILHCHDWQSAPVAWGDRGRSKCVFTIHNLNYGADLVGRAMGSCEVATTVSPTYAREVRWVNGT